MLVCSIRISCRQHSANYSRIKPYYTFPDALDVDRYTVKGKKQDMVVAVRELNIAGSPAQNWINDHLVYTHGFGFVAAPTNVVDADGKPNFTVGNIPPSNGLGAFEPRIYFGENVPGIFNRGWLCKEHAKRVGLSR